MLPVLVWLWRLMRRRSAGARGQRFGLARAHLETRVLQFAVCSCNAAHAVTQLAHPRTTSAGQSVAAAAPMPEKGPNGDFRGCETLRTRRVGSEGGYRPGILPHLSRRLRT